MADGFGVEVDTADVIRALGELGDFAQPYINEAAQASAESIAREARSRLSRQLGPEATGKTLAGIAVTRATDGNGYVVSASREPFPNLPKWIDKGTRKGKPGSHSAPARPYFDVSVDLEQGAHLRRIEAAVQDAISDRGLGDS